MKKVLVLMLLLGGCATVKEDSLTAKDYSLRKSANSTTFLSSILYFNSNNVSLSLKDKKELDKVKEFEKKYPSIVKVVSFSSNKSISKSRNDVIKNYLSDINKSQLYFEIGNNDEIVVNPNTLTKDTQFSNRTEIYISY